MFEQRRNTYLERIESPSLSLFFSGFAPLKTADEFYPFSVNRNFYYLTGINQENVCLLIAKGEQTSKTYLFLEPVDPVKALWDGAGLTREEASQITKIPVDDIKDISTLETFIAQLLSTSRRALFGEIKKIYLDLERIHEKAPATYPISFAHRLQQLYPSIQISANQMVLAELRTVKDHTEVESITKAIQITKVGLDRIMQTLKEGKFEFQMEAEFNYVLNLHRTKPSFGTIAAASKNATILHYRNNDQVIPKDALMLFDLGCTSDFYCSDITRVYPASGTFTKRQREVYEVVLNANKKAIAYLKPGMTLKEFNDYGKMLLIEGAKNIGLIKEDHEITKYYYHTLGHYLGLDVHDVGNYSKPIPEHAIITVEPGLYIQEEGIGIRIEDDVLVNAQGNINLSESIIKEIDDIEAFMKKG